MGFQLRNDGDEQRLLRATESLPLAVVLATLVMAVGGAQGCFRQASPPAEAPPPTLRPEEGGDRHSVQLSREIQTGDPLPAAGGSAVPPGQLRWLATEPRVPLALADGRGIRCPSSDACTDWPTIGSIWARVDRFGQPVGEARLAGGEGYDVTRCYELRFDGEHEGASRHLLVAGQYEPPPSVEWTPSDAERASLGEIVARLDELFPLRRAGEEASLPPLAERVIFFSRPPDARDGQRPTRWAVAGGRALAVLALEADGSWRIRHLETRVSVEGYGPSAPYLPVAAFDMNGDGEPEIVFHESEGSSWCDVLLEQRGTVWERTIESVGGATI